MTSDVQDSQTPVAGAVRAGFRRLLTVRRLLPLLVFSFPFLYFFRLIAANSSLLILGNDFEVLYYSYKAYLADAIAHGHFPLWTSAEEGGYPFVGNPFAAAVYPLNVLPIVVRLIAGNYNLWFHQIFTVFGVSLFALGLYRWLVRSFDKPGTACFTAMLLTASWSISGFMRFPNAIHALAWLPWVLTAIHDLHRQDPRLRVLYGGIFALTCQITAGYLYFVVYSYMLYGGYALYLHWRNPVGRRERIARLALLLGTPALLALPYLSAVSRTLALTTDRAGGDFGFATEHAFGPVDLVGGMIFPPVVSTEGCIYTGTLSVFLIALYLWWGRDDSEKTAVLIAALGACALIFGYRSYLFAPLWSVLPVLGRMRAFGRMTIILLPILAIAIHQGYELLREDLGRPVEQRKLAPRAIWLVFGGILLVQVFLYSVKGSLSQEFNSYQFSSFPAGSQEVDFLLFTLLTLGVLLFALRTDWASVPSAARLIPAMLLLVVTMDSGTQGRFLWARPLTALVGPGATPEEQKAGIMTRAWMLAKRKARFHRLVAEYFSLDRNNTNNFLTAEGLSGVPVINFGFESYTRFYRRTEPLGGPLRQLMGKQKLFFHRALHEDAPEFLADAEAALALASEPKIEYFNGNELCISLSSSQSGYLTWIDNFDAGWSAELDGRAAPIERSLGTFKAVALTSPGQHRLRFRYLPDSSRATFGAAALGVLALTAPFWRRRRGAALAGARG